MTRKLAIYFLREGHSTAMGVGRDRGQRGDRVKRDWGGVGGRGSRERVGRDWGRSGSEK